MSHNNNISNSLSSNSSDFQLMASNSNTTMKFPGLARPSSSSSSTLFSHRQQSSMPTSDHTSWSLKRGTNHNNNNTNNIANHTNNHDHHHNSNNDSFQQFTASCEDAWNDKIEDKIFYSSPNNQLNSSMDIRHQKNSSNVMQSSSSSNGKMLKQFGAGQQSSILIKEKCFEQQGDLQLCKSDTTNINKSSDPKVVKLKKLLYEDEVTDISQLRTITWSGISDEDRPLAWKLLLGYVPNVRSKRKTVLENKKTEYQNLVKQYYYNRQDNDEMYRQIHIDIPRMQPLITIFQQPIVQGIFERILYIWSIRHPASGYVQGMNDLVTPFFVTYLSEFVPGHTFADVESFNVSTLDEDILASVEADSYWAFNKLLDSIQDNYTFAQPGIQRLVNSLARVISRVDKKLHEHLENNSVQYLQFAFRWMNNLLIREIPLRCIIRLWDAYLSEGALTSTYVPSANFNDTLDTMNSCSMNSGTPFSSAFHLFVCAAFLRYWSKSLLQEQDFQGLMLKLQNLPTFHWSEDEVKILLAHAYQLKYSFTPNHLKV